MGGSARAAGFQPNSRVTIRIKKRFGMILPLASIHR